jgi:hypothetical protein
MNASTSENTNLTSSLSIRSEPALAGDSTRHCGSQSANDRPRQSHGASTRQQQEKSNTKASLIDANKMVVLTLSIAGLLFDGLSLPDVFFIGATVVWLWMSNCVQLEQRLINTAHSWRRGSQESEAKIAEYSQAANLR